MRRSWRKSVKRKSVNSIREAHDNMVSLDINGPLLKNGRQTGVLRCTVDAWWINDALADANAQEVMDPNDPSKSDAASMDASINSDDSGLNAIFSSRKTAVKKK